MSDRFLGLCSIVPGWRFLFGCLAIYGSGGFACCGGWFLICVLVVVAFCFVCVGGVCVEVGLLVLAVFGGD